MKLYARVDRVLQAVEVEGSYPEEAHWFAEAVDPVEQLCPGYFDVIKEVRFDACFTLTSTLTQAQAPNPEPGTQPF